MRYFFFLFLLCMTGGCSKEKRISSPLIGSWKLHSFYRSPGGLSEWQVVDPGTPQYITFKNNGQYIQEPASSYGVDRFKIKNDSVLIFLLHNEESFEHHYQINNDTLTLIPPCIEGCAYKYLSAKGR
ncbi:MAG: hypothetical protein IT249_07650 [Chitinophagaceae bacterium]|nr:hypothetical protein [Chitinophagaceae bacterium]